MTLPLGQDADDPGRLMADEGPFSVRNGRSVSWKAASSRIGEIGEESGDSEMNPVFGK